MNFQAFSHFPECVVEREAVNIDSVGGVTDSRNWLRHAGITAPAVAVFPTMSRGCALKDVPSSF
jgi:hypothetical protein